MITLAKMVDQRIVQIVRVAETVQFSPEPGWVFVCFDFAKINRKREVFKWLPISTKFMWVKEFNE